MYLHFLLDFKSWGQGRRSRPGGCHPFARQKRRITPLKRQRASNIVPRKFSIALLTLRGQVKQPLQHVVKIMVPPPPNDLNWCWKATKMERVGTFLTHAELCGAELVEQTWIYRLESSPAVTLVPPSSLRRVFLVNSSAFQNQARGREGGNKRLCLRSPMVPAMFCRQRAPEGGESPRENEPFSTEFY